MVDSGTFTVPALEFRNYILRTSHVLKSRFFRERNIARAAYISLISWLDAFVHGITHSIVVAPSHYSNRYMKQHHYRLPARAGISGLVPAVFVWMFDFQAAYIAGKGFAFALASNLAAGRIS